MADEINKRQCRDWARETSRLRKLNVYHQLDRIAILRYPPLPDPKKAPLDELVFAIQDICIRLRKMGYKLDEIGFKPSDPNYKRPRK